MANAVCKLQLGLKNQTIFIKNYKYHNKQTLESIKVPTEEIPNFIAKTSDITEVVLSGPIEYLKKIEKDTEKIEKTKYSTIKTKFTFI